MQNRHLGDFHRLPPAFLPYSSPWKSDNPLKIALLTQTVPGQPTYGGIGRYTYDLALGLHERGHEVHIFCKDQKPIHYESLGFVVHGIPDQVDNPTQVCAEKPVLNKNLKHSLAILEKMKELYAAGLEFDVVHATNWDLEGLALQRARVYPMALMLVTPLAENIVVSDWVLNEDLKDCVKLDRWQIENADQICMPSRGIGQSYLDLMDIPEALIRQGRVVPLGIIPEKVNIPHVMTNHKKLLFVGRLEPRKGIHTLLAILPTLMEQFPDWECHLVGDDCIQAPEGGTYKELFIQEYHQADWLDRVTFHGVESEEALRMHYQNCDLFVAPSLFESFGLIYQEAMQYGKPVVGCSVGGVPEVVEDGVEGLLVPPGQPAELQAALARLMGDDQLRKMMGIAGSGRVHRRVNYRTMAEKMEEVYQELVKLFGAERRVNRAHLWPRELPLLTEDMRMHWSGHWEICTQRPGHDYRVGLPDAALEFQVIGGSVLQLTLLRHPYSGVLEIRLAGQVYQQVDLFAQKTELQQSIHVRIPGQSNELVLVKLSVHSERNPRSKGNEVWLKQISTIDI
ncbi:MAG: glycosyltransferase family 4 protein [Anaerolineaceae bacterium]|nr:glycosyltransferase family 4 protein [Anaerolineaceae bacterium]